MGFVSEHFLGGAERRAGDIQSEAARTGQDFIREGTTGAEGRLETGFGESQAFLEQALQDALGAQGQGLQDIIASLTGQTGEAIGSLQGAEGRGIEALLAGLQGAETQLNPFAQGGTRAFEQQQALSGALGSEAQQAAMDAFIASPGQDFLRSSGEQSINRQAATTGGLGGGAQLADLQAFGTGLAQQDFQNQFNRLGQLSQQGQQAATNLSQFGIGTGQSISDLISGTGQGIAGLQSSLGANLANAFGSSAQNISNLFTNQGTQLAGLRTDLGANLANLLTGQASNLAGLEGQYGQAQASGILAEAAQIRAFEEQQYQRTRENMMAAFASSDRRLKENIKKIGKRGLLDLYSWTWKFKGGGSVGFMSDEVKDICPEAVLKDEYGFDMVNYILADKVALEAS